MILNYLFLKAYRKFNQKNEKLVLNRVLEDMSLKNCFKEEIKKGFIYKILYKDINISIELIIRQIVLSKLANVSLISRLVYFNYYFFNSITLCLPSSYLKNFKEKIKLNYFLSAVIFSIYTFFQIFKSLAVIVRLIIFFPKKLNSNSVLFIGFPDRAVNYKDTNINFTKWYFKNLKEKDTLIYATSNSSGSKNSEVIKIKPRDVFVKLSLYNYLIFLSWSFLALFSSIFSFIIFKWWHLFLLPETIKCKYFSLINKKNIPNKFFFTLGNLIYRPMWTYQLDVKQKENILINYGPSISGINFDNKILHYPGFKTQTWSNRYEYSIEYVNYLNQILINPFKYKLFKDIDWLDSDLKLNLSTKKRIITVFDSTPFNRIEQIQRLYFNDLGNEDFCINFLQDIIEICIELDFYLLIKVKKIEDLSISKKYTKFLKNLKNHDYLNVIDNISPKYLFRLSNTIISFPFTSIGVLAKNNNKNVCFYKPYKIELQDQQQSLGIPIKYNKDQLKDWLISNT